MALIEIHHANGDVEQRELKKQSPITIGRHNSNDVCIDEPDVAIMHCRISWVKGGFEAVAASAAPLDVNGTPKQRTDLHSGDLLRFGSVDVRFLDLANDLAVPPEPPRAKSAAVPPQVESTAQQRPEPDRTQREPESRGGNPPSDPVKSPRTSRSRAAAASEGAENWEAAAEPSGSERSKAAATAVSPAVPGSESPLSERMRRTVRSQQSRPGEEDPLRSPLVLGLAGGAAALLLTGAIFYFIATRQTTQQAFAVARQAYDEGNFRVSIDALQKFIDAHPRQPITAEARRLLGLSRVRQLVEGGAPKYGEGLKQLHEFIDEQKEVDGFETLHADLMQQARTISLGAAEAAGKYFDPQLLEVSNQARTLVKTYAPKNAPPTETLAQIEQAQRASQSLILRDDVYQEHLAAIDAALAAQQPLQGLQTRRDLLVRYPQFARDPKVSERMEQLLEQEREHCRFEETGVPAQTTDHAWPADVLTLGFLGRSRTDEVASRRAVIVLAQDACYGIDMVTGQPLWRRVIGFQTPFFPIIVDSAATVILFDTRHQELVCLQRDRGEFVWRQTIGEPLSGKPLLSGSTMYVPTRQGRLLTVNLESGLLEGTLQFSQPVSGPVEIDDGQRLIVAGEREVVYTLSTRPPGCTGVYDLGQAAGSIRAPLLAVASYLLVVENGNQRSRVQLLRVGTGAQPLTSLTSAQVTGEVLDSPVLRGRDLFIPSTGERLTAFTLSDDPGQPPLAPGPVYASEGKQQGPAYLLPGPDRQLWMATAALGRLRLTTDALQLDGDAIGAGIASQPLQFLSGFLYHARRRPFSSSVILTRTDRDEMKSDWQVVLGAPLAEVSSSGTGPVSLCMVNDAGFSFRVPAAQINGKGFALDPATRLPLAADLQSPLFVGAVQQSRIAVACGGKEPRLWILNPSGQIESSLILSDVPQTRPCGLGAVTLVPLSGSVQAIAPAGQPTIQAWTFPSGEKHRWVSIVPLDSERAIATTAQGEILQLKLQGGTTPHLAETGRVLLSVAVDHPSAAQGELLAVVDQSRRVSLFDSAQLQPRGARTFEQPLTNRPWLTDTLLLVEIDQNRLQALGLQEDLPLQWSVPLEGNSVTGVLPTQEGIMVVLQNGVVRIVNPLDGQMIRTIETGNTLTFGPWAAGEQVYVGTADGSVIRLP